MGVLQFDNFSLGERIPVQANHPLGANVRLAFEDQPGFACSVTRQTAISPLGDEDPILMVEAISRTPLPWFALEISVPSNCQKVVVDMRIYPAERIFPRVYYTDGKKRRHFDEPDRPASESFGQQVFSPADWAKHLPTGARDLRLAMLLPSQPWFRLALRSVQLDLQESLNIA